MTTAEIDAIRERLAWGHFWPATVAGKRQLRRDRAALREGK